MPTDKMAMSDPEVDRANLKCCGASKGGLPVETIRGGLGRPRDFVVDEWV